MGRQGTKNKRRCSIGHLGEFDPLRGNIPEAGECPAAASENKAKHVCQRFAAPAELQQNLKSAKSLVRKGELRG